MIEFARSFVLVFDTINVYVAFVDSCCVCIARSAPVGTPAWISMGQCTAAQCLAMSRQMGPTCKASSVAAESLRM
jgi:hypothetical protein